MAYSYLRLEKGGKIGVITIDCPGSQNRLIPALHDELAHIWRDVADDQEIKAIVLTGTGDRFLGGTDLDHQKRLWLDRDHVEKRIPFVGARDLIYNLLRVPQPIVAAVNGDAVSTGGTIALFCDIIIAADTARFCDPHVSWAVVAGDGATIIWPLRVGLAKAKEYLLMGDFVSASEAERIGLINKVVPFAELRDTAMATARRLADQAPWATQWTKLCLNKRVMQDVNLILDASMSLQGQTQSSRDHKQAVLDRVEGRVKPYP